MYKFSKRSLENLAKVDYKLSEIMKIALMNSKYDFGITEGLRSLERQKQLVKEGKSQTLNSYHLRGKAVDIVAYNEKGKVTWDLKYYKEIAKTVETVAKKKKIKITWGGNWKSLIDGPHFQIEESD